MQLTTIWQLGSSNPENANHFATISQWWAGLMGKEVTWRQRLLPATAEMRDLNWEPQRFDEVFVMTTPEVRGTTLYWRKPDSTQERNTTVHKLELDTLRQQLYIFPQSQKELVIRVGLPEIVYQTLELNNPELEGMTMGTGYLLTLKDATQQIEVKVSLDQAHLHQLRENLG